MSSAALTNTRNRPKFRPNLPSRPYQNSYQNKRETPEPEPSKISPQGLYSDPRTAMVMCSFMGTRTTVKTRSGITYKGHTTGFSEKGDIALCDAKLEDDDNNTLNPIIPGIIIHKDKFVVCKTNGVDLKSICCGADFTDSAIASRTNGTSSDGQLKQLQPWHDDDAQDINPSLTLDDPNGGWEAKDMFAVNNEKFNVQSSFNEDMFEYTTRLPDPNSEGYEERQRYAQKQAEEIEKSDDYQKRIAKELNDGDEEDRYSAVHRSGEPQTTHRSQESNSGGKNPYTIPALRGEGEQSLKNGMPRNQGRQFQRQVSPLSNQQSQHSQNPRQMNNHYQGPPPSSNIPLRTQGPPPGPQRAQQSQNHGASPSQLQYTQQQPPPPHSTHPQPPSQQQQHQRPPAQQVMSPTQHPGNKSQPHPAHHQQSSPASGGSASASLTQQVPPHHHKLSPPSSQQIPQTLPNTKSIPVATNGPLAPSSLTRPQMVKQINGDGQPSNQEATSQKHLEPHIAVAPPTANSVTDGQQVVRSAVPVTSPSVLPVERRPGRGNDNTVLSPEERKRNLEPLHEFKRNFHLSEGNRPEEAIESVTMVAASSVPSSIVAAPVSLTTEVAPLHIDPTESPIKPAEKIEEEDTPISKSKLNPNAKEFRPKAAQAVPVEAQSPSPQPRSSPHIQPSMLYYNPVMVQYQTMVQNPSRKRATVSLNPLSTVPDLSSHVTGQPLLATTQPVIMMPTAGQQAYQFYPRVLTTGVPGVNSIPLAQGGQHVGLDQGSQQGQPQAVFMTTQPQPMPAHLAPHPQPAHSQTLPHPQSNQAPQPTHIPNPAPSPVQQHSSQQIPQQMAHHMSQGPPQSLTPQPAHFSQMNLSYHAIPAMPRTTVSGQQGISAAHPTVSIGYPVSQYPYPNGNPAQYPFAPAAHPQTSQNSSHGQGPQPQYVMMPNPQGHHPPMQQNPQPYPAGIQFQTQHNIMQGPPQMPPNMGPNQGGHHLIHSTMPGIHQQVSGSQPSMYMPAAPQFYVPREGSRSNSTAVPASTIMFTWP